MGTVSGVVALVGAALVVVGFLGLRGGLKRNRFLGVRTPAALASEEAFLLANQVAGLPVLVGGAVGVLGSAAAIALGGSLLPLLIGLVGMAVIVLAGAGLGARAAAAMPEPEPALPAGCSGCACGGCSLVKR
ncbi:hypothetical protein GCM10010174_33020 [Kutzneria viridogrisea]